MHFKKKRGDNMLSNFTKEQKQKLYAKSEQNTVRNKDGLIVSTKQDPWRKDSSDDNDDDFHAKIKKDLVFI